MTRKWGQDSLCFLQASKMSQRKNIVHCSGLVKLTCRFLAMRLPFPRVQGQMYFLVLHFCSFYVALIVLPSVSLPSDPMRRSFLRFEVLSCVNFVVRVFEALFFLLVEKKIVFFLSSTLFKPVDSSLSKHIHHRGRTLFPRSLFYLKHSFTLKGVLKLFPFFSFFFILSLKRISHYIIF